jgi:NADPH2:quinone reductase
MVIPAFGGPDVFQKQDLPTAKPRAGEILVRVIASGTNPVDAKIRASGYWAKITPPVVLGYDVSGIVDEIGPGVTDFVVGDEVFYTPEIFENHYGSYAEFNVVPAAIVARKPRDLSHIEAAAVPLAGGTAWEAVIRRLNIRLWETILIHGGAGGVGSFAVQFAKATGARVIATAGTSNQATLRDLGADVCIDYRQTDVKEAVLRETGGKGVDAVFDTVGGTMIAQSLAMVRSFGRLATVLGPQGDLTPLYTCNLTLHGVFLTRERARLEEMTPLLDRGLVRPLIDQVLPLEDVAKAHERLDSGHGHGKIVLRVAED